jgi:hypothetical protein
MEILKIEPSGNSGVGKYNNQLKRFTGVAQGQI